MAWLEVKVDVTEAVEAALKVVVDVTNTCVVAVQTVPDLRRIFLILPLFNGPFPFWASSCFSRLGLKLPCTTVSRFPSACLPAASISAREWSVPGLKPCAGGGKGLYASGEGDAHVAVARRGTREKRAASMAWKLRGRE